jgi:hypothetical protein
LSKGALLGAAAEDAQSRLWLLSPARCRKGETTMLYLLVAIAGATPMIWVAYVISAF